MRNDFARAVLNYSELDNKELAKMLVHYLERIENFYYSDFWVDRFRRRCKEERIDLDEIDLCIILGSISTVLEGIKFRIDNVNEIINGSSKDNTIYINQNMTEQETNNSHLYNLVIHESGHILYSHIPLLERVNKSIMDNPKYHMTYAKQLDREDEIYFTDENELRQRIFPVIVEMKVNDWTPEDTYYKSPNLIQDNIYELYPKSYITHLINNLI